MARWKQRMADVLARRSGVVPDWLQQGAAGRAWFRASWLTRAGVAPADAARPIVVLLGWLDRHGLLTGVGQAALRAAQSGEVAGLALTRPMLSASGAAFLDAAWAGWWDPHGHALTRGSGAEAGALAALEDRWRRHGGAAQDAAPGAVPEPGRMN